MGKAIALFFNLMVLVIILKIFAPGLASEIVRLATNVVAIANEAVTELRASSQSTYLTGY